MKNYRTECTVAQIYALFIILPNSRNQSDIALLFRLGPINHLSRMYYTDIATCLARQLA